MCSRKTLAQAVVFKKRPPVPALSRWTTCVKTARVLLYLGTISQLHSEDNRLDVNENGQWLEEGRPV